MLSCRMKRFHPWQAAASMRNKAKAKLPTENGQTSIDVWPLIKTNEINFPKKNSASFREKEAKTFCNLTP
jgi:hypothetical protein